MLLVVGLQLVKMMWENLWQAAATFSTKLRAFHDSLGPPDLSDIGALIHRIVFFFLGGGYILVCLASGTLRNRIVYLYL